MSKTYSVQPNYAIYYRSASLHNPTSTPTINTHNPTPTINTHNPTPTSTPTINTHNQHPHQHRTPFNTPLICTILGASLHNPASTPTSPPYPGRAFSHLPAPATQQHQTPFNTPPHLHHPGCLTTQPRINTHLNTVPRPRPPFFHPCRLPRPDHPQPPLAPRRPSADRAPNVKALPNRLRCSARHPPPFTHSHPPPASSLRSMEKE